MGSGDGPVQGTGDGPVRAVLRNVISHLLRVNGSWWVPVGGYSSIAIVEGASSVSRRQILWAAGAISAVHMHHLLLGPDPISPWLLYIAMCGTDKVLDSLSLSDIALVDPEIIAKVQDWFLLVPDHQATCNGAASDSLRDLLCSVSSQVKRTVRHEIEN